MKMNINEITNLFRNERDIEFIKRVIDSVSSPIWYRDLEKNSLWVSSEIAKIYGIIQRDFGNVTQFWKDFIFHEDLDIVESHMKKLLSGNPSDIEFRIIRSDGVLRWVQESANIIKDKQGKVVLCTGIVLDITDSKIASINLAESEERYRTLIDLSPNFVFVHQEGRMLYANPELLKVLGARHENEVLGKKLQEMLVFEEVDTFINRLKRLLDGEKLSSFEYKVKTLDGRVIDLDTNAVAISFNGKPAVMVVGNDITEKKTVYNELKDNKQRYKSLIEFNANSVFAFDLNGNYTSSNNTHEKMSGYSKEDILKMHYLDMITPEEREKVNKLFELVTKGTPQNFRTAVHHKNGSLIHLNTSITPIIVNGQIDGVYGISQDITKQVEVEKDNEYMAFRDYLTGLPNRNMLHSRLLKELNVAKELQDTVRLQQGMIFKFKIINGQFIHTLCDGDLLYRLGMIPDQVVGKSLHEFLPTEDSIEKTKWYQRAWDGEELVTYESMINGISYLAALRPIKRGGEVVEIIGSCVDITERKKAEEQLFKLEKLNVVGELAAGVAHEIRNPLTSIKGLFQLLEQGIVKQEFFEVMLDEFNRIEDIISEFLNLAKPQEIRLKKSDLGKVVKDVETLLESEAHLQNVQISHQFEPSISQVWCDTNQIKQVFINLIKNSIEAIPNGGYVNIQAIKEGPNILIKIIDNGVGIDEKRIKKLGEPFFSNKEKGTGLGLMLCLRIISQHKGTITFISEKNQGTTVEVRLPLA
jgi:PAS domain S-box-containing protein